MKRPNTSPHDPASHRTSRGRPSRTAHRARRSTIGTVALVASAAFTGLASPAAAHTFDARLAIIHDALRQQTPTVAAIVRRAAQEAVQQQTATFALDIPAGTIREAVTALERISGTTITLSNQSIGPIFSPGVSGTKTIEEALKAILDGTNISYRLSPNGGAILQLPEFSDAVSVTGSVATVASTKYVAPLREIPQTIEVIPRAAMEAQGVTTLSEALRNVPGVTLQAGEGGGASSTAGDMFNMRGFNASNALFVDNVRDDGLVSRDVFNLEQVEVFMGPTGSDVGRGTAAGYVNMQTKVPHDASAGSATLTYGTASQRRGTFDINRSLGGNNDSWISKAAIRLNGLWQDSGVAGRDEVENGTKAIASSLALGLGTPTRVLASAQILRQDNVPDYGIPGAAWTGDPFTAAITPTPSPVDQTNYYGSPDFDYDRSHQNTATARVDRDLRNGWVGSNQTRYNKTHREAVISTIQNPAAYNAATGLVTIARQGNERENSIFSNQTSLVGRFKAGVPHSVSAGLEFSNESQFAPTLAGVGTRAPQDIYAPNPFDDVAGYAPARSAAYTDGHTTTVALYAFDSAPLNTRVSLQGGLRWEHYDTDFISVDASNVTTIAQTGADGMFSGKAGVVFRATANANVYASYGTTVTPPGAANFSLAVAPNNQNNPNVEPQQSANLEAGAKWDTAGGRLSLTSAVFHTINKNVLFTVDAAAVPPVYNQDDKQRVDGVTLGATGQITPAWQVLASFGYLDSENLSQNIANAGKRLTLTPEYSGSVWSTYRLPKGFTLGGGVRGTSEVFINSANTIKAPGYHVVDGLAEYAVNQHFTLRMNVYNLTDVTYVRNVNNNGGRYNPGYPRTAQFTTVVKF